MRQVLKTIIQAVISLKISMIARKFDQIPRNTKQIYAATSAFFRFSRIGLKRCFGVWSAFGFLGLVARILGM